MTDEKLKPCPFCGGKAKINLLLGNYCVTCKECPGAIFPCSGMTKKEAIEAWNRREKMRLIDADKLILHLNDYALTEAPDGRESASERRISSVVYSAIQNCIKAVEEQPTVFDIDKVVRKLENETEQSYANFEKYADEIETDAGPDDDWYYMGLKRAIEIIKELNNE